MILDKSDQLGRPYVLLLPLPEAAFGASLQSSENDDDYLELCVESGSTRVTRASFKGCLYMHVGGNDPFNLVKEGMEVLRTHLGYSFRLLEEKSPPGIIDKFGWCTWDAFYTEVNPKGVREGVRDLVEGGCPPGFILIDDGWQSFYKDDHRSSSGERVQFERLNKFEENQKFSDYKNQGMGAFVRDLKDEFKSVEYMYVWHAMCGYWGGIQPNIAGMPESRIVDAKLSPGLERAMDDLATVKILKNGVGIVPSEQVDLLYERLHSHLESVGIDGVKIDVMHLFEMVSEEYGGRIELGKAYYDALSASVKRHFKGNGVIASMQQGNDFMFLGTETISLGRVAGDPKGTFWLQGCHMVHCAYNSLWMGNFIHPDWDMFQSTHPCAEFHAASRAISGGPIYVSDSVGKHNFKLLKSLALPDGSILRCQYYALPTRDCFFEDPLHDGKTMLKIWNYNKYTGVLGVFNCQGGGWCPLSRRNKSAIEFSKTVACCASPKDIEWKTGKNPICIEGVDLFVVYMFRKKKLKLLKLSESLDISLEPFNYELLTVSPVRVLKSKSIEFAPIGLVNMLNTGGAIQSLVICNDENLVRIGVRGGGEMKIFAAENPRACQVDGVVVKFSYDDLMVTIQVPWPNCSGLTQVEYVF